MADPESSFAVPWRPPPLAEDWAARFGPIVDATRDACVSFYGDRLVAVALFGSVARGGYRPDSDIDLMVVADPLPRGRIPRVREFDAVRLRVDPLVKAAETAGVFTRVAAIFKTRDEVAQHPPILLDMTEDARLLFDRDGFLAGELEALRRRMRELGSRRHFAGNAWWWDLKPDYKPGEVFSL